MATAGMNAVTHDLGRGMCKSVCCAKRLVCCGRVTRRLCTRHGIAIQSKTIGSRQCGGDMVGCSRQSFTCGAGGDSYFLKGQQLQKEGVLWKRVNELGI